MPRAFMDERAFAATHDAAFDAVWNAMTSGKRVVLKGDRVAGVVFGSTPRGLAGQGELVRADILYSGPGQVLVQVASAMKGEAVTDRGKNRKHVEEILAAVSAVLGEGVQPAPLPPPPPEPG